MRSFVLKIVFIYLFLFYGQKPVYSSDNGTSPNGSQSSDSQSQDEGTAPSQPAQGSGLSSQEQSGYNGLGGSDGLTQSSNQQHSDQDKSVTTPVTQSYDNSTQTSSETNDGVSEDISATEGGSDGGSSPKQSANLVDVDIGKEDGTNMYDFSNGTFTAKQGYKFKRIVKGSHVVKEFEDYKCPVKIQAEFDHGSILLSIYQGTSSNFSVSVVNDPDQNLTPKLPDGSQSTDVPSTPAQSSTPTPSGDATKPSGGISSPPESGLSTTPASIPSEEKTSAVPESTTPEEDGSSNTKTASVLQGSEVYADHLKLLTMNEQGLSTEDASKFDVQTLTDLLNYTFKKGSKCTELNYDNQNLWKHDPKVHGDRYPTNVLLNTTTKFIVLECTGVYQYFYSFYNDTWNPIFSYKSDPSKVDQTKVDLNKLKFLTEGDDKIEEMDQTKFDKSEEGTIVKYKFKSGSTCIEVKYDSHTVWNYDASVHCNKYPTVVIVNTDNNLLTVDSSGNYRHFYSYFDNKFKQTFAYRTGSKKLDPIKLMLITLESDDTRKENDRTKFDKEQKGSVHEYKFKTDSKCVEVKYEQTAVWKHDYSVHGTNYPTSLTLNSSRNVVMVKCSDHYTQMYTYYEDKWSTGPSHGIKCHFKLDKLKIETLESDGTRNENDVTKFDKKEQGSIVTYTFKPEAKCTRVKYDDDVVWEHDVKKYGYVYPTSLTLNLNTSFLLLESKKQYQHFYSYYDGGWKSTFSYRSHAIKENLDNSKLKLLTSDSDGNPVVIDSTKYTLEESGRVYKYTLNSGSNCTRVSYEDILVWEHDQQKHANNYPTTLVFNVPDGLVMVQSQDQYLHFYSFYYQPKPPADVSQSTDVPSTPAQGSTPTPSSDFQKAQQSNSQNIKFLTKDGAEAKEIDSTQYQVSKDNEDFVIKFNSGLKCEEVECNSKTVWKFNTEHPESVKYSNEGFVFVINLPSTMLIMNATLNGWELFYSYDKKNHRGTAHRPTHGSKSTTPSTPSGGSAQP